MKIDIDAEALRRLVHMLTSSFGSLCASASLRRYPCFYYRAIATSTLVGLRLTFAFDPPAILRPVFFGQTCGTLCSEAPFDTPILASPDRHGSYSFLPCSPKAAAFSIEMAVPEWQL